MPPPPPPPPPPPTRQRRLSTAQICARLHTVEQQKELFLYKNQDVSREEINDMLKDFKKFDIGNKGEINYHEAMRLLEFRGSAKTAKELMNMVGDMDRDNNLHVTFIEWCCAYYQKSYDELFNFADEDARRLAVDAAMQYGEDARNAEIEIDQAKKRKELQAQLRATALERESKLTGVAGMKAFFARKVEGAQDMTKTNEQQIKEEAARRKTLRDAKDKMNEAIKNANRVYTAEELAQQVLDATQKRLADEAAEVKRKEEEEKAARAARKVALNAKWGSSGISTK